MATANAEGQHRLSFDSDGADGFFAIAVLSCVAFVGLVDTLINDVLPARFTIEWTQRYRHLIYMALAMGQCSLILVNVRYGNVEAVNIRYAVDSAFAACVACHDIWVRYKSSRRQT